MNQGDPSAAEAAGSEARRLAQRYGDARTLAFAALFLGVARTAQGDLAGAELFQYALQATPDDAQVVALAYSRLADAAARGSRTATAIEHYKKCVAVCEDHGES